MKPKICVVSVFNSGSENSFHAYFFDTIKSAIDSVTSSVPEHLKSGDSRILKSFGVSVADTLMIFNVRYDADFGMCYVEVNKADDFLCPYAQFAFDYAFEKNILRSKSIGADRDYYFVFHPRIGGYSYVGIFDCGLRFCYSDNVTDPA